jgi:N-acetylmuramoyl-L-alanine amidase
MIEIVSRKEWGAKKPTKPFLKQDIVLDFFLHHAVSADVGDEKKEMRTIQAQHQAAGSRDIDYGFALGRTGTFYEGRGWFIQDGATATGFGEKPTGNFYGREVTLCLLGNYENLKLDDAQKDRIREFIAMAIDLGALKKNPTIRGHRDVRATACPGQHAYDRLPDIRVPWEEDELTDKEKDQLAAASRAGYWIDAHTYALTGVKPSDKDFTTEDKTGAPRYFAGYRAGVDTAKANGVTPAAAVPKP